MNIQIDKQSSKTPPPRPNKIPSAQEKISLEAFDTFAAATIEQRYRTNMPIFKRAKKNLAENKNAESAISLKIKDLELYKRYVESFTGKYNSETRKTRIAETRKAIDENALKLKNLFDNNPGLQAVVDAEIEKAKAEITQKKK